MAIVSATNFFQTLVASFSEANAALVGPTKLLESVYLDYTPEQPAALGQTINVPLPAQMTSQVTDIGDGPFVPVSPSSSTVPLVFSHHPAVSYTVTDFSQFNTPSDIRKIFLDSALKGMLEYVNNDIASLITPTNFNAYAPIIGGTAGLFSIADMSSAWGLLASGKIPVRDFGNFFMLGDPIVYGNMVKDSTWSANSQVGYQIAGETRRYAMLGEQWGALIDFDPALQTVAIGSPYTAETHTNIIMHRHAIALATRDLPVPDSPVVMGRILMLKDMLPVRVMLGYNQLFGGWVTTVDCGYARAVIRPDHGIISYC